MLSIRTLIAMALAVVVLVCLALESWAQEANVPKPTAPVSAALPPMLMEMSEGQVVVTYENGALAVKARNAPLIEVLQLVCSQIGAELDVPAEATEPVQAALGPAPVQEVIASLLKHSSFNYATAGRVDDANVVSHLVVFARTKDEKGPSAQVSEAQAQTTQPLESTRPHNTNSKLTPALTEVSPAQAMELLESAEADAEGGTQEIAGALQQVEKQIKAGAADSSDATPTPVAAPASVHDGLVVPRRHRRR